MAMLGMQADMQCHYFPGYCSTREINLNANCSIWPLNNVDTIPKSGHYCNGNLAVAPPYSDQYSAYKEKLKLTMLRHEAIFKDQIHELHRVYNRQRELMDEMKRIKFYRHHVQLGISESNQIIPGNSFDFNQKAGKVSLLPCLNPARSPCSVSCAENNQSHLNYLEGKIIAAGCSAAQTEGFTDESELLESKFKKIGKKILDLELPAYEYIDSEQEELIAWETVPTDVPSYTMKSNVDDVQRNGIEMSQATEGDKVVFQNDATTRPSFSTKAMFLADLNEPIELEEEADAKSNDFPSPVSDHIEIPCHAISGDRNSDFPVLPKVTSNKIQAREDTEAFSNVLRLENNESRLECLSDNEEAGENFISASGPSSTSLNSSPERESSETLSNSSEDDKIEQIHNSTSLPKLRRKRKFIGLERCAGQVAAASQDTLSELIPLGDAVNCDSSLVPSWRKHTHDVVMAPIVQALPCFNSSVCLRRSSRITGDKSCFDINVESKAKFQSPSQQSSSCNVDNELMADEKGAKKHTKSSVDLNLTTDIDLNLASPTCSSDVAAHTNQFNDNEEKCKESTVCSPIHRANSAHLAEANKKLELDCNSMPGSGEQVTANELFLGKRLSSTGSGFPVDLNSCITKDESSPLPSPSSEIDLQAPVSPENEERSPPRGESDENQLETPCILSEQENGDLVEDLVSVDEYGNVLEDLVSVAAEAIVSISSSVALDNEENATLIPSVAAESVSLFWFAKLACSVVDDAESEFGVVLSCKNPDRHDEYFSDGMDYFEAMTLKLEEMKEEEFCCKANVQMEEVACPDSPPSQPRRGRTRRGRQQRKDFQSEILPSLASLSRCEVTEDLQIIGGLIEAARRSTGAGTSRNGWTIGRRRRTSTSSSKAETAVCVLLKQQNKHGRCSVEDWSLTGWGKKTRRRRGRRCPASNPQLILGQV